MAAGHVGIYGCRRRKALRALSIYPCELARRGRAVRDLPVGRSPHNLFRGDKYVTGAVLGTPLGLSIAAASNGVAFRPGVVRRPVLAGLSLAHKIGYWGCARVFNPSLADPGSYFSTL